MSNLVVHQSAFESKVYDMRFLGHPRDAHTVSVERAWTLTGDHQIYMRESCSGSQGIAHINAANLIFRPYGLDGAGAWNTTVPANILRDVISASNVTPPGSENQYCSKMFCLLLPLPVMHLVLAGQWPSLVILSRWYGLNSARTRDWNRLQLQNWNRLQLLQLLCICACIVRNTSQ
jgi:hypothetical protein